jgi:carbonic anhydrase
MTSETAATDPFPGELLEGYRNFIAGRYAETRDRYRSLAEEGQTPTTLIVACCDSRAAPETIFNTGPGELFVIRNVANLVPPFGPDDDYDSTSAALEFGVQALKVRHIVVMGHGRCGGVAAAMANEFVPLSAGDFIGRWMSLLKPAAASVLARQDLAVEARPTALERLSIRNSIANLRSFPWIADTERSNRLSLHGAWFDIASGELWVMDAGTGDFIRPDMLAQEA